MAASAEDGGGWDLRFDALAVTTNSGISGAGDGGAFGPLPFEAYAAGGYPEVPFIVRDVAAGALGGWYAYDSQTHVLYSRFHTYGVQARGSYFKLQVLSYYAEVMGAPLSAVYAVRYAEVTEQAAGSIRVVEGIDATAGGPAGGSDSPSSCLVLRTGELILLSPAVAQTRDDWDLCFRRANISVNGELGGPGGVLAADLYAGAEEELEVVKLLTQQAELADFEAVDFATLTQPGLEYRGDRVVSAFTDAWLSEIEPPRVAPASWLVLGTTPCSEPGCTKPQDFLVAFSQHDLADPWNITLHARALPE